MPRPNQRTGLMLPERFDDYPDWCHVLLGAVVVAVVLVAALHEAARDALRHLVSTRHI